MCRGPSPSYSVPGTVDWNIARMEQALSQALWSIALPIVGWNQLLWFSPRDVQAPEPFLLIPRSSWVCRMSIPPARMGYTLDRWSRGLFLPLEDRDQVQNPWFNLSEM